MTEISSGIDGGRYLMERFTIMQMIANKIICPIEPALGEGWVAGSDARVCGFF